MAAHSGFIWCTIGSSRIYDTKLSDRMKYGLVVKRFVKMHKQNQKKAVLQRISPGDIFFEKSAKSKSVCLRTFYPVKISLCVKKYPFSKK